MFGRLGGVLRRFLFVLEGPRGVLGGSFGGLGRSWPALGRAWALLAGPSGTNIDFPAVLVANMDFSKMIENH